MGLGMLREAVTGVNRHYQLSCTGASKGKGREREGEGRERGGEGREELKKGEERGEQESGGKIERGKRSRKEKQREGKEVGKRQRQRQRHYKH